MNAIFIHSNAAVPDQYAHTHAHTQTTHAHKITRTHTHTHTPSTHRYTSRITAHHARGVGRSGEANCSSAFVANNLAPILSRSATRLCPGDAGGGGGGTASGDTATRARLPLPLPADSGWSPTAPRAAVGGAPNRSMLFLIAAAAPLRRTGGTAPGLRGSSGALSASGNCTPTGPGVGAAGGGGLNTSARPLWRDGGFASCDPFVTLPARRAWPAPALNSPIARPGRVV